MTTISALRIRRNADFGDLNLAQQQQQQQQPTV